MINKIINALRPRAGWLFIAWLLSIVVLSVLPVSSKNRHIDVLIIEIRVDYLYHIIIHLIGTFLAMFWAAAPPKTRPGTPAPVPPTSQFRMRTALAVAFMILLGLALEYLQKVVPSRTFNINDVISNLLGVALGAIFTLLILRRYLRL
jgi:hypothetical protein